MESPTDPTVSPSGHPSRRNFVFRWVTYGLGGLAAAVVGLPLVGYLLRPKKEDDHWVDLGRSEDFEPGQTRLVTFENPIRQPWDGLSAMTGVYVRRLAPDGGSRGRFLVFAVNCAHLGCPVEWFPQSGLFMCPCHGGVYYADGERASGPPTRGLFECDWREQNGKLELKAPHYPTLQDTERRPS
jgi:menaquinol-cytochrome c reductase iron-sulfur subunit